MGATTQSSAEAGRTLDLGARLLNLLGEPRWDVPETVAIKVAVTGPRFDRELAPNQPYSLDEIRATVAESLEAGAASCHLHVRDESGAVSHDLRHYRAVIEPIRERYGRRMVFDGAVGSGDASSEGLASGLFEMAPVNVGPYNVTPSFRGDSLRIVPAASVQRAARAIEDAGCKPVLVVHEPGHIGQVAQGLIGSGLVRPPYFWCINPIVPGQMYMPNPAAMAEMVLFMRSRILEVASNSVIEVGCAGRSSVYLATFALLMGLHLRVGMEDMLWRYPHLDRRLESNGEILRSVVAIAGELGRRPATADELRAMVGLPR